VITSITLVGNTSKQVAQNPRKNLTVRGFDEKAFTAFVVRCSWRLGSLRQQPFGGPEHALHYLARYTHRVAISNHRLLDVTDGETTFRWKDYARDSKRRTMTLTHCEFLRRFQQHVLPRSSHASATSASSPTVGAVCCCLCAAGSSMLLSTR